MVKLVLPQKAYSAALCVAKVVQQHCRSGRADWGATPIRGLHPIVPSWHAEVACSTMCRPCIPQKSDCRRSPLIRAKSSGEVVFRSIRRGSNNFVRCWTDLVRLGFGGLLQPRPDFSTHVVPSDFVNHFRRHSCRELVRNRDSLVSVRWLCKGESDCPENRPVIVRFFACPLTKAQAYFSNSREYQHHPMASSSFSSSSVPLLASAHNCRPSRSFHKSSRCCPAAARRRCLDKWSKQTLRPQSVCDRNMQLGSPLLRLRLA